MATVLTQRSLIDVNEGSKISQAIVTFSGGLNQAKRIAPKRLDQRRSEIGASCPLRVAAPKVP